MSPLLRLSLWQIKNIILSAFKSPKKLIPALLFLAWVLWMSWSWTHAGQAGGVPPEALNNLRAHRDTIQSVTFLTMTLFAVGVIDKGFAGGSLRFVPADIDYLFAAPFSRRRVLLLKLFAGLAWNLGIVIASVIYLLMGGGRQPNLPAWAIYGAVGLCFGGFANLAVVIELVFALNRWLSVRRLILTALVLVILWVGFTGWRHGLSGVTALAAHGWLPFVFFPCRYAAQAVVCGLAGRGSVPLWPLILFYLTTLALIFSRNENYYEAALSGSERIWQAQEAARENPWGISLSGRGAARKKTGISYTFPPFGHGAMALFWAHISAAAKRPFASFVLPALGGLLIGLFAVRSGENAPTVVAVFSFYYLAGGIVGGIFAYRHSLVRQGIIRPLPLTAQGVVAAEIAPRFLLALPFYYVAALTLLIGRGFAELLPALVLCSLPAVSLCFHLLQYTLALWYPSTQDKLQSVLTSGLQFVLVILLMGILSVYALIPPRLGAPNSLTLAVFFGGTLLTAAFLWIVTVSAYANHQPEGSPIRVDTEALKRYFRPVLAGGAALAVAGMVGARIHQANMHAPIVPKTVEVRRGDLRVTVTETGTIQPVGKVDVKSKVAGRLLSIPIQEGQFVRQGQLIATVDRTLLDPQIARTQAQLAQANARYRQAIAQYQLQVAQTRMSIRQAQSGVDTALASLHTAQAHLQAVKAGARPQTLAQQTQAVQRAQIALADAQRTQKRKQSLVEKGFLAQQELDSAQTAVDTAKSNLLTVQQEQNLTQAGPRIEDIRDAASQVDAQKAQVSAQRVALASAQANAGSNGVRLSDVAQAKASVDQIAGDLAQLMVQVGDTRILAPASGVVLKKYKERTEIVQSATSGFSDAQAIVATLGDRPRVLVGINEVDIDKVRVGMPVDVRVDAVPGEALQGKVVEIAPASTNAFDAAGGTGSSGTGISKFSVKVGFARYDPRLRAGMSAQVDIISAQKKNVLLLPLEAVPFAGPEGQVSMLSYSGVRPTRRVHLGLRTATEAEVISGLHAGQTVLVASGK